MTKVENMVENICVLGSGTKNMMLRTYDNIQCSQGDKEHFVLCMCSWGIMIKSMKMTRQCGTEIIDNYISTAALCVIFGLPGLHGSLSKISVPTQGNTARSTISGYGTSNFMHWHNFFSERGTQNTCVFRTCIARQNAYDYLRLLLP